MRTEYRKESVLPTGEYPAKVLGAELDPDGQYGPQIKWVIGVTGEDDDGDQVTRDLIFWTPTYISDANKYGKLAQAVGLTPEDVSDTDELVGKSFTASVVREPDKKDASIMRNKIIGCFPKKAKRANGRMPEPVLAGADEDEL